jgi:hypothetical protein
MPADFILLGGYFAVEKPLTQVSAKQYVAVPATKDSSRRVLKGAGVRWKKLFPPSVNRKPRSVSQS